MGSDRARLSYDEEQQYRSVVMQQGRVTLEADWNESQQIASEALRLETLDIVGPAGTPDDGYKIVLSGKPTTPPYDFRIHYGTMYVGGVRAFLPNSIRYSHQSEWLDASDDPDWVAPATLAQTPPATEFVYLLLREQEVSAVEDSDLKDVALGGPDTAQRTRLIQHIARLSSQATACASGLAVAEAKWDSEGLDFNPATMRLSSRGRLEVGFSGQTGSSDPCQPQNQGGYLGADNQLIRVQISGVDQATGNPTLLWGYDDASFLYRVDLNSATPQVVHLQSAPVDALHQPRSGQTVEVLRSAALLHNGEYVASTGGIAATLTAAYDPDSQTINLPSPTTLTSEYFDTTKTPRAFLRVWEEQKVFTPGTPVVLGMTGLQVTLKLESGKVFHPGDYWLFAARPSTPQEVYPEKYLAGFQPPDGPRLWACPLGVITWSQGLGTLASDCRIPFCHLTDACNRGQGCCEISVKPGDLTATNTLQTIVNQAANPTLLIQAVDPGAAGNNITLSISNQQTDPTSGSTTFDLTVTEIDTYNSLTTAQMEGIVGDDEGAGTAPGLAHVLAGSVNVQSLPANNQTYTLASSQGGSAQVNVLDVSGQLAFTLQAKKPGVDGSLISATISNANITDSSFTLTLAWTKTQTGLTPGNLLQSVQTNFAYEITAQAPSGSASAPAEGNTQLQGGTDGANATTASAILFGQPTTICLLPGNYRLAAPLRLLPEHSNLTIKACGGGVTISAAFESPREFALGLVLVDRASHVALRGLSFELPAVPLFNAGFRLANLDQEALTRAGEQQLASVVVAIGLRVLSGQWLTVEGCTFNYPSLQSGTTFTVGVFAAGDCAHLSVRGNSFLGAPSVSTGAAGGSIPLTFGYLQAENLQVLSSANSGEAGSAAAGILIPSSLDDATFHDNRFQNLQGGIVIEASVGSVRFDSNQMDCSEAGIDILSLESLVDAAKTGQTDVDQAATRQLGQQLSSKLIQYGASIATGYPLPSSFIPSRKIVLLRPAVATGSSAAAVAKAIPVSKTASDAATPEAVSTQPASAPATPPTPVTGAASGPALQSQMYRPLLSHIVNFANDALAGAEGSTLGLVANVAISNNEINAVQPAVDGVALAILSVGKNRGGALTMVGNRLRNLSATYPTAAVSLLDRIVIAGNLILNEQPVEVSSNVPSAPPPSLLVRASTVVPTWPGERVRAVAITGNVLRGTPTLPLRSILPPPLPVLPSPMDRWEAYNTEV
ncbi:MAG TPA: DUF6519 domain-containing protein [Terriglobia bacterium]|nr:DUF6519 domain-containing protein [Terriglobia bacterium]